MAEELSLFEPSNYLQDHSLYIGVNKKLLHKMKDETVAIRPKMYLILEENQRKILRRPRG